MAEPRTVRFRLLRQVVIPLLLVTAMVVGFTLRGVWLRADLDPSPAFKMGMFGMMGGMLAALLLLVWFMFVSGFRWRTRLAGLALLLLAGGAAAACVREVEVDGNMQPILVWRWEALPEADDEPSGKPADLQADPANSFPRYRGPLADGVVRGGPKLAGDWSANPPRELWRKRFGQRGAGFAGFAVAGDSAVTVEQRGPDEVVVCYNRADGAPRWVHAYPAQFIEKTGNGPRATPTLADGEVYSLGATGELVCLDGRYGQLKWRVNILEDNSAKCVIWGMTSSPLVTKQLVIVNAGVDPEENVGRALVAYDRQTGKRVWGSGTHAAGYSSPQLATLAGREQVLLFDAGGLAGFDLKDGKELWRHEWKTFSDMNIIQPLVLDGDRVFISSETDNGCVMLKVSAKGGKFSAEPLWENQNLCSQFANPVTAGGSIYGLNSGYLVCLDAETGERRWRARKYYGHGQVLLAGARLLVCGEKGEVALVDAAPGAYREVATLKVFKDNTWNTPALAGRQLFLRNHVERVCLELPVE